MNHYLIDSNIIIDYFRKDEKAVSFLDSLEKIKISVITAGEAYQGVRDKKELNAVKEFFRFTEILPVNETASSLAINLLEKYTLSHGLLILDAIIAATATSSNLILKTGNYKHFQFIKDLQVEKW